MDIKEKIRNFLERASGFFKRVQKKETGEERNEEKECGKTSVFWSWVIPIYVILFIAEIFWLSNYSLSKTLLGKELEWNWGMAAFLVQVFYTLVSFKTVGPTELGAKLFFGKPLYEVSSGLVFIPFGIFQLKKETRLTIQDEIPADPQHIFRREDTEIVPSGFFPPIRIPFGFAIKEKKLRELKIQVSDDSDDKKKYRKLDLFPPKEDPLNIRVTAEVVSVIRWQIKNYIQFLITIGNREEARRQMEDCTVGSLTREFAKITPAVALANLGTYGLALKYEIEQRIEGWGIEFKNAQIKTINFHRDLNTAIGSVPEAEFKKKTNIIEGQGLGAKEKAILIGRTDGLKQMAKDLKIDGSIVLGAETARAITQNPGQKTIIAGPKGFSDLIATASAIGENFKKEEDKK
jgi:regulator of protease activity HflC (stomatin/prohibitin superfamily)